VIDRDTLLTLAAGDVCLSRAGLQHQRRGELSDQGHVLTIAPAGAAFVAPTRTPVLTYTSDFWATPRKGLARFQRFEGHCPIGELLGAGAPGA
jgi:hypothetical protein